MAPYFLNLKVYNVKCCKGGFKATLQYMEKELLLTDKLPSEYTHALSQQIMTAQNTIKAILP